MATDGLNRLLTEIGNLKRGLQSGRPKPHKLIMLLAVLDLAEDGLICENRIYFDEALLSRFRRYFAAVADDSDWCQPGPPFFHLRTSGFWHHKVKPGHEVAYTNLTTSGGGSKRILDNIEYAYLSDYAFSVVSDASSRGVLRQRIRQMCSNMNKMAIAFHESFLLKRASLSQLLSLCIQSQSEGAVARTALDFDQMYKQTTLGRNEVKSMRRYAYGTGLVDEREVPTRFALYVYEKDPKLSEPSTQWLLHYHLVAPHRVGPAFWNHLATTILRPEATLNSSAVAEEIKRFNLESGGQELAPRTFQDAAAIFLGTYGKSDGLGALGILEETEKGVYRVAEPRVPDWPVVAYVLADFWQGAWPDTMSVDYSAVTRAGGPASLLLLNSGEMGMLLRQMQENYVVELEKATHPWKVKRLWKSPFELLERVYA